MPYAARKHESAHTKRRKDFDQFYGRARWQTVRSLVLGAAPNCVDPFSEHLMSEEVVLATQVDHIVPREIAPELAFALSNLQGLCARCHGLKSQQEGR